VGIGRGMRSWVGRMAALAALRPVIGQEQFSLIP
jgi:hypothetical protein